MNSQQPNSINFSRTQVSVRGHLKAVTRILRQQASSSLSGSRSRRLRRFAELLTDATPGILTALEQPTIEMLSGPTAPPSLPLEVQQ